MDVTKLMSGNSGAAGDGGNDDVGSSPNDSSALLMDMLALSRFLVVSGCTGDIYRCRNAVERRKVDDPTLEDDEVEEACPRSNAGVDTFLSISWVDHDDGHAIGNDTLVCREVVLAETSHY